MSDHERSTYSYGAPGSWRDLYALTRLVPAPPRGTCSIAVTVIIACRVLWPQINRPRLLPLMIYVPGNILFMFPSQLLSYLPPFCTSDPGSHSRHSSPLPRTNYILRSCVRFFSRKFSFFFPLGLSSKCACTRYGTYELIPATGDSFLLGKILPWVLRVGKQNWAWLVLMTL